MQTKAIIKEITSPEEMYKYGAEIARHFAKPPFILALKGDLGAGKTTFLKGFISALTSIERDAIHSPTFTYLQVYGDHIYHFDLYRLTTAEQFESAGFADYLHEGICCIEWADRIEKKLPSHTYFVEIEYKGPTHRKCIFYQKSSR